MLLPKRIWRDIEGFEGLYQVSNTGQIRSLRFGKTKILKVMADNRGYKSLSLYKNGKGKTYRVHRLVAQAFIPNPNNLPEVNHKDENKANNHVSNLEWISHKDNVNYGTRNKRTGESLKGKMAGENNPMYGKHHTEEAKNKMSAARKKKHPQQLQRFLTEEDLAQQETE